MSMNAKNTLRAVLLCLAATPASAATFTYVGSPFAAATNGFRRVTAQFSAPGALAPNTTYTMSRMIGFNDGLNKLPALTGYLSKGMSYGGQLDSFIYGTVTTDASSKPVSWLFKVNVYYVDGMGNEGYDLVVAGPGNSAAEPGVFDSLYTTLPLTLPGTVSLSSTHYGTMTAR